MPTNNPLPPKENALFKRILVSCSVIVYVWWMGWVFWVFPISNVKKVILFCLYSAVLLCKITPKYTVSYPIAVAFIKDPVDGCLVYMCNIW